ncbi:MAG: metallophosphoesterase family protein, partial [Clostridium celatum]|nr:metallophosphoesterase family protein [Clostridium celatum]
GFEEYSLILPYPEFTETAYKATATDLQPGSDYYFAVGNKEGELSEEGQFTTAVGDSEDFTFIHYTDTQNAFSSENQRSEADYSASVVQSMLDNEDAQEAKFAVHTGDVVNDHWNDTEWNMTLDALNPLVKTMPHLFVTGNHDNENFLDHINTPQAIEEMTSGAAYTTRYNGVQFITLNTEQARESDDDQAPMIADNQMEWFKAQLEDAKKAKEAGEIDWIIVNYHRPLFSSSYHALEDENVQLSRDELMKTLDDYDVDAVLNGHDHNLSITHSLTYDPDSFGKAKIAEEGTTKDEVTEFNEGLGTVFFVPSTAGTKTYDAIYKNQSFDWVMEEEDIDDTFSDLFDHE